MASDPFVAFDPFRLTADVRERSYSTVPILTDGAGAAVMGYRTHGPERPPPGAVFVYAAVCLHRRGKRIVHTRGGNGPSVHRPAADNLVSLFPAGWEVRPNYLEPCEGLVVAFTPRLLAEVGAAFGGVGGLPQLTGLDNPVLSGLCETLWRADGGSRGVADAVGRAMAMHIFERYGGAKPATPAWFRRAERHIHEHLGGQLGVEDIAAVTGMSRAHFSRLFKRVAGVSPHEYVLRRRVERAKELLHADPTLPLSDIAAEVGFCDQSHLTARFRELTGVTPAAYRAELR